MNRMKFAVLAIFFAVPAISSAETWNNVSLVDLNCSAKVKANPDVHTRNCALQCAKSGYAIVTSDGTLLKLDTKGNQEAVSALQASQQKDHLRVNVSGERDGDTVKVESLKM